MTQSFKWKMSDSKKRHEILSRRPSYRKILDELQGSKVASESFILPKVKVVKSEEVEGGSSVPRGGGRPALPHPPTPKRRHHPLVAHSCHNRCNITSPATCHASAPQCGQPPLHPQHPCPDSRVDVGGGRRIFHPQLRPPQPLPRGPHSQFSARVYPRSVWRRQSVLLAGFGSAEPELLPPSEHGPEESNPKLPFWLRRHRHRR